MALDFRRLRMNMSFKYKCQVLDIKLVFLKLSISIKSIMCEHASTFYSSFNRDKITIVNPLDEKTKSFQVLQLSLFTYMYFNYILTLNKRY